ncbi:rCG55643 [Rattus norvegicus]|uniref:RCG55643 n=1 Tax=Rattus norvegicus TaxID=10116 RepID=A6JRB4_RAT|nr:rCG55643 [Rattus norvegicus]
MTCRPAVSYGFGSDLLPAMCCLIPSSRIKPALRDKMAWRERFLLGKPH